MNEQADYDSYDAFIFRALCTVAAIGVIFYFAFEPQISLWFEILDGWVFADKGAK